MEETENDLQEPDETEQGVWLQHDPWLPLPKQGVICIDTGCGKGGRLTAMMIEGTQYRLESV